MAIIVLILGIYLLALSIDCAMIMIWSIIVGIVKWILLVLTTLISLFK